MATIRDVARESNVSIATVSRVFNNSPLVSDTTRQRVAAVAAKMGYWPNGIARSLITSRTHTVGVLLPDLHGEFFSEGRDSLAEGGAFTTAPADLRDAPDLLAARAGSYCHLYRRWRYPRHVPA